VLLGLLAGVHALRFNGVSRVSSARMCDSAAASPIFSRRNLFAGGAAVAVGAVGLQAIKPKTPIYFPTPGSMAGQTVVITGANTGLGFESALRLAAADARVVVTARTEPKAQAAVAELRQRLGDAGASAQLVPLPLDLASLASVAAFPAALQKALGDSVSVDVRKG